MHFLSCHPTSVQASHDWLVTWKHVILANEISTRFPWNHATQLCWSSRKKEITYYQQCIVAQGPPSKVSSHRQVKEKSLLRHNLYKAMQQPPPQSLTGQCFDRVNRSFPASQHCEVLHFHNALMFSDVFQMFSVFFKSQCSSQIFTIHYSSVFIFHPFHPFYPFIFWRKVATSCVLTSLNRCWSNVGRFAVPGIQALFGHRFSWMKS